MVADFDNARAVALFAREGAHHVTLTERHPEPEGLISLARRARGRLEWAPAAAREGERVGWLPKAAALALAASATASGGAGEIPQVAKAIMERKKAPPLAKPKDGARIVRVSDARGLVRAIGSLRSGTTIMIAPGTYRPGTPLVVGPTNRNAPALRDVAIRGETGNRDDVKILGRGQENRSHGGVTTGFQFYNVENVLLADLSIGEYFHHPIMCQGGAGCRKVRMYNLRIFDAGEQFVKGTPGGPGRTGAKDCIVEYCLIEYTKIGPVANDGYTQGVDFHRGDRIIVRDCIFRNQHVRPGLRHQYGPAVLMWNDSRDTVVERCVFLDCDRGVALGLSNARSGTDHRGGVVRNNFFYTSKRITNGDCPIIAWNSPGTQIYHNTVLTNGTYMNAIEYRFPGSSGLVIANNITDAPIASRNGARAELYGNFTKAQPGMFVGAAGCDLHLKAPVAAIVGRAQPLRAPVRPSDCADDFDGHARRTGRPTDIGADQYASRPAVPDKAVVVKGPAAKAPAAAATGPQREEEPRIDPRAAELYRSARAAERSGLKAIAKTLYERLLKEHPGSPLAQKARKALGRTGE